MMTTTLTNEVDSHGGFESLNATNST